MSVKELSTELSQLLTKNNNLLKSVTVQAQSIKDKLEQENILINLDKSALQATNELKSQRISELEQKCLSLQKENNDLNKTLELVMQKYRSLAGNIEEQKIALWKETEGLVEQEKKKADALRNENLYLQQKLFETIQVMRKAVAADETTLAEDDFLSEQVLIESLLKENEGLRQILELSYVGAGDGKSN